MIIPEDRREIEASVRSPKEMGSKENNYSAWGKFRAEQQQKRKVKLERNRKLSQTLFETVCSNKEIILCYTKQKE